MAEHVNEKRREVTAKARVSREVERSRVFNCNPTVVQRRWGDLIDAKSKSASWCDPKSTTKSVEWHKANSKEKIGLDEFRWDNLDGVCEVGPGRSWELCRHPPTPPS